ncbi:MAG: hypothetical protein NTV79_06420 [Candidatus Aureabacteria bacterium]|nr:hypothetical protein [Candidatus Auribacterota bacterium]
MLIIRVFKRRIPVVPILILLALFGYYLHFRFRHASLAEYGKQAVITVTDPATGIVVRVKNDGRTLVAFSPNGKMLWAVDAIAATEKSKRGRSVISRIGIEGGAVRAVSGRGEALFSLSDGTLLSSPRD